MRPVNTRLLTATILCAAFAAHAADEEIKIGVNLPLSGNLVAYGKSTLEGITLGVDHVNAAGGVGGKKLIIVLEDNKGKPEDTTNAYKKLAGSDKVLAVIGPITSTNALNVRRTVAELKVPLISPTATNDKVTIKNPYLFRTCFNDSFQGKIVASHAIKNKGCKTAAILTDMNSDYSKGLSKSFKESFEAAGGKIVTEEGYQQKDTEFGAQLKKILDSGAETLFVPGYPPELPLIIKQAKVIGLKARLCGADGWDDEAVINGAGDNVDGCFIVGAFSREDTRPAVKDFIAAFEKTYGKAPGTFAALGYDSVMMLREAFKTGITPEAIRNGLAKIVDLELATGKITIKDGDAVKSAVILEIQKDGEKYTTKYKATIAP